MEDRTLLVHVHVRLTPKEWKALDTADVDRQEALVSLLATRALNRAWPGVPQVILAEEV